MRTCKFCKQKFPSVVELDEHHLTFHKINYVGWREMKIVCEYCNQVFTKETLGEHLALYHLFS